MGHTVAHAQPKTIKATHRADIAITGWYAMAGDAKDRKEFCKHDDKG